MSVSQRVVCAVTGLGVLASIGLDAAHFWASLAKGKGGIGSIQSFSTEAFSTHLAGELPAAWSGLWQAYLAAHPESALHDLPVGALEPCTSYAILAAEEAIAQACVRSSGVAPARIALVMGTSMAGMWSRERHRKLPPDEREARVSLMHWSRCQSQTALVADAIGAAGPRATFVSACTASTNALGYARDLLAFGQADLALVGGMDALSTSLFGGFYALGAMSQEACAPFSEPIGMTVGEGAGFVVLERKADAMARGQTVLAELLGYGLSSDSFHAASPDPGGKGIARCLTEALSDAGLSPTQIGYYNAHGTGTEANDAAEWQALLRVFGEDAHKLPVSATKSFLGHTQGAAGILESIATIMAMQQQVLLPTLHFTQPRRQSPTDLVTESQPRPAQYKFALKHSAAFGGANTSLVWGLPSAQDKHASTRPQLPIGIWGGAAIGPHGAESLREAILSGVSFAKIRTGEEPGHQLGVPGGWVPEALRDDSLLRRADLREQDDVALFLTMAIARGLENAGVSIRGALRDKAGLIVGLGGQAPVSADLFLDSLTARGVARGAATAFVRSTMNACAGAASIACSLRGLHSTMAGRGSGLMAAIYGAILLSTRPAATLVVAAGVDSLHPDVLEEHHTQQQKANVDATTDCGRRHLPFPGEGAACVVMAREGDLPGAPACWLTGWGMAGPDHLQAAIRGALEQSQHQPNDVTMVICSAGGLAANIAQQEQALEAVFGAVLPSISRLYPAEVLGYAPATTSAFGLLMAIEVLMLAKASATHASPGPLSPQHEGVKRPILVLVVTTDQDSGSAAVLLETKCDRTRHHAV